MLSYKIPEAIELLATCFSVLDTGRSCLLGPQSGTVYKIMKIGPGRWYAVLCNTIKGQGSRLNCLTLSKPTLCHANSENVT